MGIVYFTRTKNKVRDKLGMLIAQTKCLQLSIKFIRLTMQEQISCMCRTLLERMGWKWSSPALMLYPPPSKMKGVAERRIAILKVRSQAMLNQADFSLSLRNSQWSDTVRCAKI